MEHIADEVDDPEMKKRLVDCEGIGTPATQSATIERLKEIKFIEVKGKQLHPTPGACEFIKGLPKKLTDPVLTAMWETALSRIESKEITLDHFMNSQIEFVTKLTKMILDTRLAISLDKKAPADELRAAGVGEKCPKCQDGVLTAKKAFKGDNAGNYFLGCSAYPNCKHTQSVDVKAPAKPAGKPAPAKAKVKTAKSPVAPTKTVAPSKAATPPASGGVVAPSPSTTGGPRRTGFSAFRRTT
jgi:DNA topoisomerase-3